MNVEPEMILLAALVMAVAALVQGSVGFGANMLASPAFALIDPDLVPGPLIMAAAVLTVATAVRERHSIDWTAVSWCTAGRIPGAVFGAIILSQVTDTSLQLMVALSILVAVMLSSGWIQIPTTRPTLLAAGSVSGFGATTAGIGGPPVALLLKAKSGPVFRSTMGAYFSIGTFITLPAIAAAGHLGSDEIIVGFALVPGAMAGFLASGPLRRFVDRGRLRPLVLALAVTAALALIFRVIWSTL